VTRRRLKGEQRREQLIDIGAACFAEKPYDDVMIQEIAAVAGVSRALMYHYFPTKGDLYAAILQNASDRFIARFNVDRALPLAEQLAAGLEAHIESLIERPIEAVAINRATSSDGPAIQETVVAELVDQLVAQGRSRDAGEIAVEGWLAFVRAACVKWIDSKTISRDDLTEMCLGAFDGALQIPTPASCLGARVSGHRRGCVTAMASVDDHRC
jgi:AcrR family transcriptional regulator